MSASAKWLAAALLSASAVVHAQVPMAGEGVSSLGLAYRGDALEGDRVDWNSQRLDYAWRDGNRRHVGATLVRESRFGLVDGGVELRGGTRLAGNWSISGEVGIHPDAEVLPEWFADVQLQAPPVQHGDSALVGIAGLRRTRYRDTTVDRLALGGEVYRGAWRLGYTFNLTRVDGSSLAGHDLALDRYYGDASFVGVRFGTGREDVRLATGVVASEVDSAGLLGRHWWTPRWALEWGFGHVAQSGLYDRGWGSLGVRHAF